MSFTKKPDIIGKCDDNINISENNNKSDNTRCEPTANHRLCATTCAQTNDITVAEIETIEATPKDKCSKSYQNLNESSESVNNGLTVDQTIEVKPILKRKSLDEIEIKTLPSILKKRDSFDLSSKQAVLKRHSLGSETDQRNPSLLLTTTTVHDIDISSTPSSSCKSSSQIPSILKHKSFDEKCIQSKEDQNLPKPILKKNLSIEENIERNLTLKNGTNGLNSSKASPSHLNNSTKSILKIGSDEKISSIVEVKSILKTGPKSSTNDSKPVKSALKKSDQNSENKGSKIKSIIKNESIGSNEEINPSDTTSSSSDEEMEMKSDMSRNNDSDQLNNNSADIHYNRNINSIPSPNTCALNLNDENNDDQRPSRLSFNHKKLDQKRPSSCIIMSSTKSIDIDIENSNETERSHKSISDRLAALKHDGEESWKRRVPEKDVSNEVELRVKTNNNNRNRSTSIADRVSRLEDSSLLWKNRVEEKDVKQFTVESKMNETETPVVKTPDVQKKTPKATPFRSEKTAKLLNSIKSEQRVVPKLEISDNVDQNSLNSSPKKVISIPKLDDESFNSFFINESQKLNDSEKLSDDVFVGFDNRVSSLLIQKKSTKRHDRRTASNPIRRLAARTNFTVESYIENSEETQPNKKSKELVKSSSFAASALAGLASREDIRAVAGKLRSSSVGTRDSWKCYDMPNSVQNLMLLQIKGRRRAQTRLVEPKLDSINSGDSYILVTKENLFVWIGQYSNVIERTKALEIANQIQEKKDLCFRSSNNITLIDGQNAQNIDKKSNELFLKELNSSSDNINPPKPSNEDEIYEEVIIGTNMVYHVNDEQLVPFKSYWGQIPKYEMLTSDEAFVFDFGPEMYVWVGNRASTMKRKCALDSAKELWNKGYDYSDCDINPFGEMAPKTANQRPIWAYFMKVVQNMETLLFKDKFFSWNSTTSFAKSTPNEKQCRPISLDSNIDFKSLVESKPPEPDMILETSHLGRGVRWDDELEGRHISITSLEVKCWQISEYEEHELDDNNKFCFYSGQTYVVRWNYRLSRIGILLKTGNISRHSMIGRDRTCYFFWNGRNTSNTEKGALALMTVELDKEKAQQVRVSERREEPCFLNLFKGSFIILRGKRGQNLSENEWKMFYIRGLLSNEASLIEVECKVKSLRSRTSFAFVNSLSDLIYLWNGSKCLEETRKVMKSALQNLIKNKSSEMGLKSEVNYSLKELEESHESNDFWQIFTSDERKDYRNLYYSLLEICDSFSYTPRLFHLSSSSGEFKPKEIFCSFRSSDHLNPYPFLQEDIYDAQQPTFFLFDNENQIFLWESKFAFSTDPNESEVNTTIGSVNIRWSAERKCALEFTLSYCFAKNSEEPPNAHVVCAGLEPDSFSALFPEWKYREDVALIHSEDGRKPGEMVPIQEVLSQLRSTDSSHYSLEEIRKRPEGLNPLCLESYLSAEDFHEIMGMSRDKFYSLPSWKQTSLKKRTQLF